MEPSNNLNEPLLNAGYATIQEYRPTYGNSTTPVYPISSLTQPKVTHLKVGNKLVVSLTNTENWIVWTEKYFFGNYVVKLHWNTVGKPPHEFTYPCHSADHQKEIIADVSRQLETFARQNV